MEEMGKLSKKVNGGGLLSPDEAARLNDYERGHEVGQKYKELVDKHYRERTGQGLEESGVNLWPE
jgi:hypothetical protein